MKCRTEHREINKSRRNRDLPEDLPICETENKCERVLNWQDDNDKIRTDIFQLDPSNIIAMSLYSRIVSLSDLQYIEYNKGDKRFSGYLPSLSALPFVFDNFSPSNMSMIEKHKTMMKIQLIHSLKKKYAIG